jgi:hypothetical protein
MTPIRCASELAKMLQGKFDGIDYHPTAEGLEKNTMHIYPGYLPRATTDEKKRAMNPCITVRVVKVEDTYEGSTVDLELLVTTYNKEFVDGYLDLAHILELCRQWMAQNIIIGNMFQLEKPLTVELPEEQGYPTWWGVITASYTIPRPGVNVNQLLEDENNFI